MILAHAKGNRRPSFTLVELLVVIAIIALLVSILTAAVWKALVTSNRVKNQNEISQLAIAVENFKQKFQVGYLPSRFILCERRELYYQPNGNPKSQLHADSVAFLEQMWPRLNWNSVNKPGLGTPWAGIDWTGRGTYTQGEFLLEGDQCLVFFLGGIPDNFSGTGLNCTGFSTKPENPALHTTKLGSEVIPPFFEFSSDRLRKILPDQRVFFTLPGNISLRASQYHYSYLDTYRGKPYAYFSSYKTRNGYNRYATSILLSGGSGTLVSSDCTSLFVWPYAESLFSPPRYLNPNTFQIISAGADGQFGRGSDPNGYPGTPAALWTPAGAGNTGTTSVHWNYFGDKSAGIDDQSNFFDSTLGTGTGS